MAPSSVRDSTPGPALSGGHEDAPEQGARSSGVYRIAVWVLGCPDRTRPARRHRGAGGFWGTWSDAAPADVEACVARVSGMGCGCAWSPSLRLCPLTAIDAADPEPLTGVALHDEAAAPGSGL